MSNRPNSRDLVNKRVCTISNNKGLCEPLSQGARQDHDQWPLPRRHWTVERLPGGFKVVDANGQSLAYFDARENDHDANTAGVLTMDEARRMASNFAKLPILLGKGGE